MQTRRPEAVPPQGSARKNQAVERRLRELRQGSKFRHRRTGPRTTTIELEGLRYRIERIADPASAELSKSQKLLEDVLGQAEVDSEEILRHTVAGSAQAEPGRESAKYLVFNVKDAAQEVVCVLCGGILDLPDRRGNSTDKTILLVTYAATGPTARKGGLAREAYVAALREAAKESARHGKTLVFAAGECTDLSEAFWNRVGWKRVYQASDCGFSEVDYLQPALYFDSRTGEPAPGTGEVPEHIMLDSFGAPVSPSEVIAIVTVLYRWYHWIRDDFDTRTAFLRHRRYMKSLGKNFLSQFAPGNPIRALLQSDRRQLQHAGVRFKELAAGSATPPSSAGA